MTEQIDNAAPRILQAIQSSHSMLDRKLGTLAESFVRFGSRIDGLTTEVNGVKNDLHVIALAIDEHSHRLAAMEDRLGTVEQHLTTIERHLPLTRQ